MVGGGLANMIGINTCGGQPGAGGGGGGFSNTWSVGFDGSDDRCEGDSSFTTWNGLANVSFNLWFKRHNVTSNEMLMSQYGTGGNNFYIYCVGNSRLDVYIGGQVVYRYTGTTFASDTWYNLGFSLDGTQGTSSQRPSLYLNGGSRLAGSFGGPAALGTYTSKMQLSGRDGANFELFGNLDEISIWSATLTEADHAAIYNSGTPLDLSTIEIAGLQHWWRCGDSDGGEGTTLSDATGSYSFTLFNHTTFEEDVP
jgi:hypothetical protein